MVRTGETHAHVRTGGARTASREAAAASAPPPAELRGTPPESRRTPRSMPPSIGSMLPLPSVDEQSAAFDKFLQLRQSRPADPASDVVRFGRRTEGRELRRFLERHRSPGARDALDLLRQFEVDVSVQAARRSCHAACRCECPRRERRYKGCRADRGHSGPSRWSPCPPREPRLRGAARAPGWDGTSGAVVASKSSPDCSATVRSASGRPACPG